MRRPPQTDGPIRALLTIPNLDTAGSGRALARVVERFDPAEVAASVCVFRPGGALVDELEAKGIEVLVHPLRVPLSPRLTLPQRARAVAAPLRGRFDVWHSYDYLDDYAEALVARAAKARWAYTKKNMSWNHRSWWIRTALARGVAVQNHDMLKDFFGGAILGRRAEYVPRGIPITDPPDPAGGRALRAELGIEADAPVVVCVAQVIPRKGQILLAEAMAHLPGVHLLLAGAVNLESYGDAVRAEVERSGATDRVHWLGHVTDVGRVLSAADVFCLPTGDAAEGCPVALLEAMAAGVASVATDVPGSRDVIVDGRSGRLAPADDVPALAAALGELVADPVARAALAAAGRDRVAESFSIEGEVAAHVSLYRHMLGRPDPSP